MTIVAINVLVHVIIRDFSSWYIGSLDVHCRNMYVFALDCERVLMIRSCEIGKRNDRL